jgi:hypothetical protein
MNKFLKFFLQIQNQQIIEKSVKLKIFFSISTLSKLKLILNHALISLHIIEKKNSFDNEHCFIIKEN